MPCWGNLSSAATISSCGLHSVALPPSPDTARSSTGRTLTDGGPQEAASRSMTSGPTQKPVFRREPASSARGKPDDIVVFWILRDSVCGECGTELAKGRFLRMEGDQPLCLRCADLDHLVFLPRGHTALTRRASKPSTLRAVVVRFSRTRKRYERQGVLVGEAALAVQLRIGGLIDLAHAPSPMRAVTS